MVISSRANSSLPALRICLQVFANRVMNRHARTRRAEKEQTMNTNDTADKPTTVAEQGAHVAPAKAVSKKEASKTKAAPTSQTAAKRAKTKAALPKKEPKSTKKAAQPACTKQEDKENKWQRATRKRIEEEERRHAVAQFLADLGAPVPPAADQRVTTIAVSEDTLIVYTEGDSLPEIYFLSRV